MTLGDKDENANVLLTATVGFVLQDTGDFHQVISPQSLESQDQSPICKQKVIDEIVLASLNSSYDSAHVENMFVSEVTTVSRLLENLEMIEM
jgi:hypothetical protein